MGSLLGESFNIFCQDMRYLNAHLIESRIPIFHMCKKSLISSVFVTICLAGLLCFQAHAGIVIDADIKDMRFDQALQYRTKLLIEGERLKIDTTPFRTGDGRTEALYDSSKRVFYVVSHTEQSYIELDEVVLFDTIDSLNAALRFLKRQMGVADVPKSSAFFQVRETDETRIVANLRSRKHVILRDGGIRQEVWVATWEEAGIEKETLGSLKKLAKAYEKVMSNLGRVPLFREVQYVPIEGLFQIDGYPVAIKHFENGKLLYDVQLGISADVTLNPMTFLVPKIYERAWTLD